MVSGMKLDKIKRGEQFPSNLKNPHLKISLRSPISFLNSLKNLINIDNRLPHIYLLR